MHALFEGFIVRLSWIAREHQQAVMTVLLAAKLVPRTVLSDGCGRLS